MDARARALLAAAISIDLVGCAHQDKEDLLPQDGPTISEVYEDHFERSRQRRQATRLDAGRRPAADHDSGTDGYTRSAENEIEQLFPRLPNPDLVLYVFPHLTDHGYPVPGYSTTFPMYESVEYALPGEAEGWR